MSSEGSDNGAGGGGKPAPEIADAEATDPAQPALAPEGAEALAKLEQEKRELHDRLLRTAAEFENWKKRAKKENEEAQTRGREGLLKELLPVLDNLERALKHAPEGDPLATGVRLV